MIATPIMHYSPRRLCFFCLQQEESMDIVNIASWFLMQHSQLLYYRTHLGLRPANEKLTQK